jgi:lipopolysaccharide export system protein LptA
VRARRLVAWLGAGVVALGVGWPAGAQPVEVEDARRAAYEAASDTWTLEGDPVRLRRADLVVEARTVRYRARAGTFEAAGGVRVVHGQEGEVQAETAGGSLWEGWVELRGEVQARYRTAQGPVQLTAPTARVDFRRRTVSSAEGVRVSWQRAALRAQEIFFDGAAERATARGSPVVSWEELQLQAALLVVDLRTQTLWASGGVRLHHPTGRAQGEEAEVRWRERVAVLRGQVVAERGADRLQAEEVRYAWERGTVSGEGRVRVVVHP